MLIQVAIHRYCKHLLKKIVPDHWVVHKASAYSTLNLFRACYLGMSTNHRDLHHNYSYYTSYLKTNPLTGSAAQLHRIIKVMVKFTYKLGDWKAN